MLSEVKLVKDNSLKVDWPTKVYVTAKASDDGANADFRFSATISVGTGKPAAGFEDVERKIDESVSGAITDVIVGTKEAEDDDNQDSVAFILLIVLIGILAAIACVSVYIWNKRKGYTHNKKLICAKKTT